VAKQRGGIGANIKRRVVKKRDGWLIRGIGG
jgi:hypothetical protein